MKNYFPKRSSDTPLLSLSTLYDVPVGFVLLPYLSQSVVLFSSTEGNCCSISEDLTCSWNCVTILSLLFFLGTSAKASSNLFRSHVATATYRIQNNDLKWCNNKYYYFLSITSNYDFFKLVPVAYFHANSTHCYVFECLLYIFLCNIHVSKLKS